MVVPKSAVPWRIILLDEIDSTHRSMMELYAPVSSERLVLVADHQQAGRGRNGRSFEDVARTSLVASFLVALPGDSPVHLLALATGNAAALALRDLGATDVGLKWPNDLEAHGAKLGGILADGAWSAGSWQGVVGLGVNLLAKPNLVDGRDICSVTELIGDGPPPDFDVLRERVLLTYLQAFDAQLLQLLEDQGEKVVAQYRLLSSTIGSKVRIQAPHGEVIGWASDIDAEGRLLVASSDGVRTFHTGEVHHLRVLQA